MKNKRMKYIFLLVICLLPYSLQSQDTTQTSTNSQMRFEVNLSPSIISERASDFGTAIAKFYFLGLGIGWANSNAPDMIYIFLEISTKTYPFMSQWGYILS